MNSFKKLLSARRRRNKLTLRKLGELTGISASYLSEIENGVKPPPKDESKIKRLGKALQYDHEKLMDLAKKERAKGKIPNVLEKLFTQDEELAWALCREAEKDEDKFRELFKNVLKSCEDDK